MPSLYISINGKELTRICTAEYISIGWRIASSRWEDTGAVLSVSASKERLDENYDTYYYVENLLLRDGDHIDLEWLPSEAAVNYVSRQTHEDLEELRPQCQLGALQNKTESCISEQPVPSRQRCGLELKVNGYSTENMFAENSVNLVVCSGSWSRIYKPEQWRILCASGTNIATKATI